MGEKELKKKGRGEFSKGETPNAAASINRGGEGCDSSVSYRIPHHKHIQRRWTFTFEERKRKKAVGEKALKKKGRGEFTKRERKTRE